MKKQSFLILAFLVVSSLLFYLVYFLFLSQAKNQVCINSVCFNVEIADSQLERENGLRFRENLDENQGMLFIFSEEARYTFWMKDVRFALDIIWINENKEIVEILPASPCPDSCPIIIPNNKAKYVLEINRGLAEKYGFKPGDEVKFKRIG